MDLWFQKLCKKLEDSVAMHLRGRYKTLTKCALVLFIFVLILLFTAIELLESSPLEPVTRDTNGQTVSSSSRDEFPSSNKNAEIFRDLELMKSLMWNMRDDIQTLTQEIKSLKDTLARQEFKFKDLSSEENKSKETVSREFGESNFGRKYPANYGTKEDDQVVDRDAPKEENEHRVDLQPPIQKLTDENTIDSQENKNMQIATDRKELSSDPTHPVLATSLLSRDNAEDQSFATDPAKFESLVTILLFRTSSMDDHCFAQQISWINNNYPKITLMIERHKKTLGEALNFMISKVSTKYFLHLNAFAFPAHFSMHNSVGWLLHALENAPDIDFIGGSELNGDKLRIPCHRLNICNWVLSQKYEYKRSIGDVMLCDEISSSFLGRTKSFLKVETGFDGELGISFTLLDFFLRAKELNLNFGVRPEIIFTKAEKSCAILTTKSEEKRQIIPFAVKHKIFRIINPDGRINSICDGSEFTMKNTDICHHNEALKAMLNDNHWALAGTMAFPHVYQYLVTGLVETVKFLEANGIRYYIRSGTSLGAVKMRRILPWDHGDVDIAVYMRSQHELYTLLKHFSIIKQYTVSLAGNYGVDVYCTPHAVANASGGAVSLLVLQRKAPSPKHFIKLKVHDVWLSFRRDLFLKLRQEYGVTYLQHRAYSTNIPLRCNIPGHNACVPDFKELLQGTAGTYHEYFCGT